MKYKRFRILSLVLIAIASMTAVSCSLITPSLNIPYEEYDSCSADVQISEHSVKCGTLSGGDRQCDFEGTVENTGSGTAYNVQVRVQWSAQHDFVYWTPDPIAELQPGQTAEFEARFNGYETPDRYDIYVECDSYQ